MIDYIWSFCLIAGILFCFITGNINVASESILNGAKEAVELCITMAGTVSFWCGIMNIAEKSGLTEKLSKKLSPFISPIFKSTAKNKKAFSYLCLNLISNFLGLGWAATPAGISAMKEMQKINPIKDTATDDMCLFLIINISSIQLIPLNMIAMRSAYASGNPFIIIAPSIIATLATTVTAMLSAGIFRRLKIWK